MSILIRDSTVCEICELPIRTDEKAYLFPAFAENPQDRLFRFSDGAFHETCVMGNIDGRRAVEVIADRASKIGPGKRKCQVCGAEIMDPDDCAMVDYLCRPEVHPLGAFNYTYLHRSHSDAWPRKGDLQLQIESAFQAGLISKVLAERIFDNLGLPIPASVAAWK